MNTALVLLDQEITSDIETRLSSMSSIKTLTSRYNLLDYDKNLLLQHSIPMTYSIWEGFIQQAFQIYIRTLNRLELSFNTLCKPMLIFHLENKFKQFTEYPKSLNKKLLFFKGLNQFYHTEKIDINPVVNTESNVGFAVLNKILAEFNLETIPEYHEPRYSLKDELDKSLLKIRNNISHGQNSIVVTTNDITRAVRLVTLLMDLVFERIRNGFIGQTYLN